jgi:hypothetical protein
MPEQGSHIRKPRTLVEYECFVSANLRAAHIGFPVKAEEQLDKMYHALERDVTVLGACCGARAKKGQTRAGYDATFNVAASSIMAAGVTAACAFRNALDRIGLEEIDIAHVEVTRSRSRARPMAVATRALAV